MGTRIKCSDGYPFRIRHPLFVSRRVFPLSNFLGHARGRDPASLNSGYGLRKRCVKMGPVSEEHRIIPGTQREPAGAWGVLAKN
jgi:hypothetical protein